MGKEIVYLYKWCGADQICTEIISLNIISSLTIVAVTILNFHSAYKITASLTASQSPLEVMIPRWGAWSKRKHKNYLLFNLTAVNQHQWTWRVTKAAESTESQTTDETGQSFSTMCTSVRLHSWFEWCYLIKPQLRAVWTCSDCFYWHFSHFYVPELDLNNLINQ